MICDVTLIPGKGLELGGGGCCRHHSPHIKVPKILIVQHKNGFKKYFVL